MADFAGAMFGAFSPLGGGSLPAIVTPTVFDPVYEMWSNEDWLGRPIRPESPYSDYGPAAYKFYGGASEVSKVIADAANRATGGDVAQSGWADVSPEYIDHMFGFVTGGMGRFTGQTVDAMAKIFSGQSSEIEARDIPFYRAVQTDTSNFLDLTRFYTFREEVRSARAAMRAYKAAGQSPDPEVAKVARLEAPLKRADKKIRELRKKIKAIKARPDLTGAEKSKLLAPLEEAQYKWAISFNRQFLIKMGPQGE
jgi:hypothetical protein